MNVRTHLLSLARACGESGGRLSCCHNSSTALRDKPSSRLTVNSLPSSSVLLHTLSSRFPPRRWSCFDVCAPRAVSHWRSRASDSCLRSAGVCRVSEGRMYSTGCYIICDTHMSYVFYWMLYHMSTLSLSLVLVCVLLDAITCETHTWRMYSTGCYNIYELSPSLSFSCAFYWVL